MTVVYLKDVGDDEDDCWVVCAKDDPGAVAFTERDPLRDALEEIRDHWACQYDHPNKSGPNYAGSYGIGVTDGHRAAANIAREALAPTR